MIGAACKAVGDVNRVLTPVADGNLDQSKPLTPGPAIFCRGIWTNQFKRFNVSQRNFDLPAEHGKPHFGYDNDSENQQTHKLNQT